MRAQCRFIVQTMMRRNMGVLKIFLAVLACYACGAIAQTIPACYSGADPCGPTYPCPVGVQVPQGADCQSYYQCVTSYDWVYLNFGCQGLGDFNFNLCTCANLPCGNIDNMCPGGLTSPPSDPGIAPEPCAAAGPCTPGSDDVPDVHTCSRYFTCSATGTWQAASCPNGEIFDPNPRRGCVEARAGNLDVCAENPCFKVVTSTESLVTAGQPLCYIDADPCAPTYPCNVNVKVPSSSNCKSYYQCVTPLDWVFFDNGCPVLEEYDVKMCSCQNEAICSDIDELCPEGLTTPPGDPGVAAEPCVETPLCNENSTDVPDIHTCSRFFKCGFDQWLPFTCPEGEIFDPNTDRGCVEARNNNLDICNDKICVFP